METNERVLYNRITNGRHRLLQNANVGSNVSRDLSTTEELCISAILDDIQIFLSLPEMNHSDFTNITTKYPALGQTVALLSQNEQVLSNLILYRKVLNFICWFCTSKPSDVMSGKVSLWAQKLLWCGFNHDAKRRSSSSARDPLLHCSMLPQLSSESFLKTFQSRLCTFISTGKPTEIRQCANPLARSGSAVLHSTSPTAELLEAILENLPPHSKCSALSHDVENFYDTLCKKLDDENSAISHTCHVKAARKYSIIVENAVLRLLSRWIDFWPNNDLIDTRLNPWMIQWVNEDSKAFDVLTSMLHSIMIRLKYHAAILDFVLWMIHKIQKSLPPQTNLFVLYPMHLRSLAYLIHCDLSELDDEIRRRHNLKILDEFLSAVSMATVKEHEVQMLLTHSPKWWDSLKSICQKSDENVRLKACLLASHITGDEITTVVQNPEEYF